MTLSHTTRGSERRELEEQLDALNLRYAAEDNAAAAAATATLTLSPPSSASALLSAQRAPRQPPPPPPQPHEQQLEVIDAATTFGVGWTTADPHAFTAVTLKAIHRYAPGLHYTLRRGSCYPSIGDLDSVHSSAMCAVTAIRVRLLIVCAHASGDAAIRPMPMAVALHDLGTTGKIPWLHHQEC